MTKRELTDSQWEKIRPHPPEFKRSRRGGRPPADNRACFEGILWVLRSGARWKDLPEDFPSPAPAGGVCAIGKKKICGSRSGGASSANWTPRVGSTGKRPSPTAPSPRQKKGRLRRKNQTWQGYEVDGGGRRPRHSFGSSPRLGLPQRSHAHRENPELRGRTQVRSSMRRYA
jgi:hypothetical protein